MARVIDSLWFRVALATLAINAILVPSLYYRVSQVVERGQSENFVGQVRTYARLIADELEIDDALDQPERLALLLDSVILSGGGVLAEIRDVDQRYRSLIAPRADAVYRNDDFAFGGNGDQIYYLSLPINRPDHDATLIVGFDEAVTHAQIAETKRQMIIALAAFAVLSTLFAVWFARRVTKPVRDIQAISRRVASGEVEQRIVVETGVGEIKALAEDLESMRNRLTGVNARLRREISDREAAESSRQALEQRLAVSQRLETVGTLAGGVAHEFNNLLTPILLLTENVLDDLPPDHPAREDLLRVEASARRARKLVHDVLTFSRGFNTEQACPVSLADVVGEVCDLLEPVLSSHGITLEQRIDAPAATVAGGPDLLHQVVTNLLVNADHAMRDSGGTLVVHVGVEEHTLAAADLSAGNYAYLEVEDTGHGMDAITASRVFEPFFTTRPVGHGTGLGLSVVHGIVKSMSGAIRVESTVGCGSKFRVLLPLIEAAARAPDRKFA